MKYRQVVGIGELLGGYGEDIICIDVEKEGGQDRSLGDAVEKEGPGPIPGVITC